MTENNEIKQLEKNIKQANKEYYNGRPSVGSSSTKTTYTDEQFDKMLNRLHQLDPTNKLLKKVGDKPTKNKVELPVFMGSLEKVQTEKKLQTKIQLITQKYETQEFCISDKLDGISALYLSKEQKLYTRGDGTIGQDISFALPYIQGIPKLTFGKNETKDVLVRGELVITHNDYNTYLSENNTHPRNIVSGALHSKTPNKNILQYIQFVAYENITMSSHMKQSKQLEFLQNKGFKTPHYTTMQTDDRLYNVLHDYLQNRHNVSQYPIDGLVIMINTPYEHSSKTTPPYGFAFKLSQQEQARKTTTVENIQWNPTKTGKFVPTIAVKPVTIGGVEVSKITGHNAQYVVSNQIGKGTVIEIIRSGDVIPKVENVIEPQEPTMPDTYQWKGVDIFTTDHTNEQIVRQLQHFVNKLNMKGLQQKSLEKIVNNGCDTIYDLLQIREDTLQSLFGPKQGKTIYTNIQKLYDKQHEYANLMVASQPFPEDIIGVKTIRTIQTVYPEPHRKDDLTQDDLQEIEGIGSTIAECFIAGIPKFKEFLEKTELEYYIPDSLQQEATENSRPLVGSALKNAKIVITGQKNKELKNFIEENGGEISDTVSKKTTAVIINQQQDRTTKIQQANKFDIPIYTIEQFYTEYK